MSSISKDISRALVGPGGEGSPSPGQEQQERLKGIEERGWGTWRRETGGHRGERLGTHMLEAYVEFFFLTLSLQDREGEKIKKEKTAK